MRLHWFSPLPPARSAIAEYSARLLPELAARAEVVLWSDLDAVDPEVARLAPLRRFHPDDVDWTELNRGDLAVYHLGNDARHHAAIWEVSRRHPGLVVLHDHRLHHLIAGVHVRRGDRDGYLAAMEALHGERGRQEAERFWDGWLPTESLAADYPLTELATATALAVLVHSAEAGAALDGRIACPHARAALPFAAGPAPERSAPAPPPHRLIVIGHIGPNRGIDALLEALHRAGGAARFELDLYGELWDEGHVRARVQALGLGDRVRLHGFVPAAELEAALDAAHLAINLRWPSMGEASLSLLHQWAHALPVVVTRVGWYAEQPGTALFFVEPGREVEGLQAQLAALAASPARFAAAGQAGWRVVVERHAPAAYADALLALARAAVDFRPAAAAVSLARRVARELALVSGLSPHALGAAFGAAAQDAPAPPAAAAADPLAAAVAAHRPRLQPRHDSLLAALEREPAE